MKRQIAIAGIATVVGVAGLSGVGVANALGGSASERPMDSMVEALSTKFNLNKDEVQAVFDEQHEKMEAAREAEVKSTIDQLVKDGKLTQAQADALLAKRTEIHEKHEAARESGKTREEVRSEMKSQRAELEAWAKDNGIDAEYLRSLMGGRGHGNMMRGPAAGNLQ